MEKSVYDAFLNALEKIVNEPVPIQDKIRAFDKELASSDRDRANLAELFGWNLTDDADEDDEDDDDVGDDEDEGEG